MKAFDRRPRVEQVAPVPLICAGLLLAAVAWCDERETGQKLYLENCAACHGKGGKGDGPGMGALPVKPTDHTDSTAMSGHTDEYLFNIIAQGGMAVGRSPFMPAWEEQLTEPEISALVAYIRTLATKPTE